MSNQPESQIFVILRRIEAGLAELKADVVELKSCMTAVEIKLGQLVATKHGHHAIIMARLDRVDSRLDRLERHAGIMPA